MTSEAAIQQQIRLALSQAGATMFRQNTGQAWSGARIERLPGGKVLIHDARPVQFGLCVGSSDLIGWTPLQITPDMVGRTAAIFTAIEVKRLKGRATEAQSNFIHQVTNAGGIAGIARSPAEAVAFLQQPDCNGRE